MGGGIWAVEFGLWEVTDGQWAVGVTNGREKVLGGR